MVDTEEHKPLISIITVCYKALGPLIKTVEAVALQEEGLYEHIIVDGGSQDGTKEWLEKASYKSLQWISEPDKGLYDAMNKGLSLAKGTYVWFINAGDLPESPQVLAQLAQIASKKLADILYGEVHMMDNQGKILGTRSSMTTQKLPNHLKWQDMRYGMVVSHQGFLPKRSIAPAYIDGNLCADIDWVIRCLKGAKSVVQTDFVLARFEIGGLSRQHHWRSLNDRYKVLRNHFGWAPNLFAHLYILLRGGIQRLCYSPKDRY